MMKCTLCALSLLAMNICWATPELSPVFQSGMLVQREVAIPIWGKAAAGEKVIVHWRGKNYSCTADEEGTWKIELPACKASSKGCALTVSDSSGKIVLEDVIIGDLWLASGQSNMQRPMSMFKDTKTMSKDFDNKDIRILQIDTLLATDGSKYSLEHYKAVKEQGGVRMTWKAFTPQNTHQFSAVASTFANYVQEETGVPIGIIGNAVGGSGVESWLPQDVIDRKPMYQSLQGAHWMEASNFSAWMRGRAKHNLTTVMASGQVPAEELEHPFKPAYLFERATAPLTQLPVKGVIWYQGESNAEDPDMERNAAMIQDMMSAWREAFKNDKLPFYTVQLPRIKDATALRAPWAYFREAQEAVALADPYTEIICTLDLGEATRDVHPSPKAPVGRRLADVVLRKSYGKKTPSSPRIVGMKWSKKGPILKVSAPLTTSGKGEEIAGFKVALDENRTPEPVKAQMKGTEILLSIESDRPMSELMEKAKIYYNFDVYCEPNLISKDGKLPLFPWRSK